MAQVDTLTDTADIVPQPQRQVQLCEARQAPWKMRNCSCCSASSSGSSQFAAYMQRECSLLRPASPCTMVTLRGWMTCRQACRQAEGHVGRQVGRKAGSMARLCKQLLIMSHSIAHNMQGNQGLFYMNTWECCRNRMPRASSFD